MATTAKPKAKSGLKRAAPKKRPRKAKAGTRGLTPQESVVEESSGFEKETQDRITREGGVVLAAYRDPLGRNPLIIAVLPLDKVEPTPFQRDVSDMHHKRLADVLDKHGAFEFVLAGQAHCPNCQGEILEKTLVESVGGVQAESDLLR
jgi:ParB family chromosome partitioning protein